MIKFTLYEILYGGEKIEVSQEEWNELIENNDPQMELSISKPLIAGTFKQGESKYFKRFIKRRRG